MARKLEFPGFNIFVNDSSQSKEHLIISSDGYYPSRQAPSITKAPHKATVLFYCPHDCVLLRHLIKPEIAKYFNEVRYFESVPFPNEIQNYRMFKLQRERPSLFKPMKFQRESSDDISKTVDRWSNLKLKIDVLTISGFFLSVHLFEIFEQLNKDRFF